MSLESEVKIPIRTLDSKLRAYSRGSSPPLLKGWQRQIRLTPIQLPRTVPYFSTACTVYSEQVGVNRQEGGKKGDINVL